MATHIFFSRKCLAFLLAVIITCVCKRVKTCQQKVSTLFTNQKMTKRYRCYEYFSVFIAVSVLDD